MTSQLLGAHALWAQCKRTNGNQFSSRTPSGIDHVHLTYAFRPDHQHHLEATQGCLYTTQKSLRSRHELTAYRCQHAHSGASSFQSRMWPSHEPRKSRVGCRCSGRNIFLPCTNRTGQNTAYTQSIDDAESLSWTLPSLRDRAHVPRARATHVLEGRGAGTASGNEQTVAGWHARALASHERVSQPLFPCWKGAYTTHPLSK